MTARTPQAGQVDGACGGLVDSGQDEQQRCFADAVRADQADFAVVGDVNGNALEQVEGSKR